MRYTINAFIFGLLFLIMRFVFPSMLNKNILSRLQAFAPMEEKRWVYWLYQVTNVIVIVMPIWLDIRSNSIAFLIGVVFYIVGIWLLVQTILVFNQTAHDDFASIGIYLYTRHPMYYSI